MKNLIAWSATGTTLASSLIACYMSTCGDVFCTVVMFFRAIMLICTLLHSSGAVTQYWLASLAGYCIALSILAARD